MNIIPAFRDVGQCPEPWTTDVCDIIRRHMTDSAKDSPVLRRRGDAVPYGDIEVQRKFSKDQRDKASPQVMALHREGMTKEAIGRVIGRSSYFVSKIIAEAHA